MFIKCMYVYMCSTIVHSFFKIIQIGVMRELKISYGCDAYIIMAVKFDGPVYMLIHITIQW